MTGLLKASRWIAVAAAIACGLWLAGQALAGGHRTRIVDRNVVVVDDDDASHPRVFVAHGGTGDGWSFLGVHVEEETELPEGGARVLSVIDDTPAEAAGIEEGDVIVGIDGRTVRGPAGLRKRLRDIEPGTEVRVDVIRDGQSRSFTAEPRSFAFHFGDDDFVWDGEAFGEKMEGLTERLGDLDFGRLPGGHGFVLGFGDRPKLGVELVSTTPELREHLGGSRDAGVLVGRVLDGMPAEAAGVRVGDLIEAVDGETVRDADDLVRELRDRDGTITLDVVRDGRRERIDVTIPERDDEPSLGPRARLELLPDPDDLGERMRRAIEDAHRAIEQLHIELPAGDAAVHPAHPVESAPRRRAGLET